MDLKNVLAFAMLAGLRTGHADVILKFRDAQGAPMAGVSCAQPGGSSGVSDATGTLRLPLVTSAGLPGKHGIGRPSFSRVPLAPGEKALLTLHDVGGRRLLSRSLSLGERLAPTGLEKGVYYVTVAAPGRRASGRMTHLGEGLVFEGVARGARPVAALAKAAAGDVQVTCTRAGYPSQVYHVADGTTVTFDFSRPAPVPLYGPATRFEPDVIIETPEAIITRWSDRARDRHAREDQYQAYDHYLPFYWENRTAILQISDSIAKGGRTIRVDQWTQWPLDKSAREFRAFYRGIGTVAEYHYNVNMQADPADSLHYYTEFSHNGKEGRDAKIGDRMEIEVSQFLDKAGLVGRDNYYGTTYLYIVGQGGLVPWEARGVFGQADTEREDSYPLPETAWLGGRTTVHRQYTDEPDDVFMQTATNLAPRNGQVFVQGRRVLHTSFEDGSHDEPGNPAWDVHAGKAGPNLVNISCSACHRKNGRALPPADGAALDQYVFKVGGADGGPHPRYGSVLQPKGEGKVTLTGWTETAGLRKPAYAFAGGAPEKWSARISPQLVGMGLLEAIPETAIQGLADPEDDDQDGISGRMNIVTDYEKNVSRLGRFGWKAGQPSVTHQVAGALNTDIGVTNPVYPAPDCGPAQAGCGDSGSEISDENLRNLSDYVALLGVRARRDNTDPAALQGEALFKGAGCASCHAPQFTTGAYHPKAELRNQVIRPYTDLLLHDMGPGLADNLGEGMATGSEWRTAPLWNIGLTAGVSGGEAYLHDGRARTLREAILWHGGEAEASAHRFRAMTTSEAEALIKFLKSL